MVWSDITFKQQLSDEGGVLSGKRCEIKDFQTVLPGHRCHCDEKSDRIT